MAKINLLPWRAERRKQRQQEFMTMLGVAAAAGVLISLLIVMYYIGQTRQENRNTYLRSRSAARYQIARDRRAGQEKGRPAERKQVTRS